MKKLKIFWFGLALLCSALIFTSFSLTKTGSLKGVVTDANSGATIPFANIILFDEARNVITGGTTDMDGHYHITSINQGTYYIEVSFTGYNTFKIENVKISEGVEHIINVKLRQSTSELSEVVITYDAPLISETRSMKSIAAQAPGVVAESDGYIRSSAPPAIRGARSEGTIYFVDGIKVRGAAEIPDAHCEGVPAIKSSGRPAQCGDQPNPLFQYDIDFKSPSEVIINKPVAVESDYEAGRAGILTAGEINDFSKWELWNDLNNDDFQVHSKHWKLSPANRYSVQLTFLTGTPVVGANIYLLNKRGEKIWETKSDNTGKAELWASLSEAGTSQKTDRLVAEFDGEVYNISNPKLFKEGVNMISVRTACKVPSSVDIAFVVDATGSMGDEIRYLQAELNDVISRVRQSVNADQFRVGSVFYRDHHDDYITRVSPFSDEMKHTMDFLKRQSAMGGGDYPEALIDALDESIHKLEWEENSVAKIMFIVLDAPPHHSPEDVIKLNELIKKAAAKGIRIIPIASSGINKSTEFLLRSMALATNGTYTFLTDHSGVGNPHIEPSTDSYKVELLNDLLVRLIHQFTFTPLCDDRITETAPTGDSTGVESAASIEDDTLPGKVQSGKLEWQFYPNPTKSIINLEFSEGMKEIMLTDLRGKLLQREVKENETNWKFDLGGYPRGVYFIRFLWKKEWKTEQVVRL